MCKAVYVTFFYNMFPGIYIWRNIPVTAVQETPRLSWNPDAHGLEQKSRPLIHNQPQKNPIHFFLCRFLGHFLKLYPITSCVFQAIWYNIFAKQLEWNKECFCTVMQPGLNNLYELCVVGSPMNLVPIALWSSGQSFWLQIQRSRVRSPALPDFLSSSGSGTRSTQPREVKLRSYLNKKVAAPGSENRD